MAFEFDRNVKDATLVKTKALPAAGATNQTDTFDTGRLSTYPMPPGVQFEISIPAMAAHSDTTKNVVIKMQHSGDNITYGDLDTGTEALADVVVTLPGVASTGTVARVVRVPIPSNTFRYIQFNQAVDSGGPTLTGTSVTYAMVF